MPHAPDRNAGRSVAGWHAAHEDRLAEARARHAIQIRAWLSARREQSPSSPVYRPAEILADPDPGHVGRVICLCGGRHKGRPA